MVNPNLIDLVFRVPFSIQDGILIQIAKRLRRMNFEIDSVLEKGEDFIVFRLRPTDNRKLSDVWALAIKRGEGTGILGDSVMWEIGRWVGRNGKKQKL